MRFKIQQLTAGRSLAGLSLAFDTDQMKLIQLDSIDVNPLQQHNSNSIGTLYPGQRMDFILGPPQLKKPSMMIQFDEE